MICSGGDVKGMLEVCWRYVGNVVACCKGRLTDRLIGAVDVRELNSVGSITIVGLLWPCSYTPFPGASQFLVFLLYYVYSAGSDV